MPQLVSEFRSSFGWTSIPSELILNIAHQDGNEVTFQARDLRIFKFSQDITSLYLIIQFRQGVECYEIKAHSNAKFCEIYIGKEPDSSYLTTLRGNPSTTTKDEFIVEWLDSSIKTQVVKLKFISLKKVNEDTTT